MRLADFVLAHIGPILAEWEVFARGIWPDAAGGTTDPATLRDHAEDMLRAAVTDMKSDQTAAQQSDKSKGKGDDSPHQSRVDRVSSLHGFDRHDSGFSLPTVIAEYRALRGSVIRLWSESHPDPDASDLKDLTRFNESIDQSLTRAVLAFSKLVERERQAALDNQSRQTQKMREVNESLLVSSVRQHELIEQAQKAEAALRQSEELRRFSMQAAGAGTWTWEAASGLVTWSAECYELFGIDPRTPLHYESWRGALHPDDRERADNAATRAMERRESLDVEYRINHPTRGERWLTSLGRIIDPVNRPGFMTGISLDITERRRLEKQTEDQAAALLDLHRRKDEFLAMLSHELRNPLAPIANAVQLLRLQRGSENEIGRQARTIIERQTGQLKLLVDDLLEVSRITTGRIQLRREQVAVSGVVERAVETARPLIKQRRHQLTVSQPPESIWLYADAARLEQVVVNLLTNAAKYTEEGGHIWVTVLREGEAAVLRVRDTGVGIAPELLPRIFDLFTQAERSLDRSEGGLGIGLSLVQRLVELHGGTVEAYSVLGQGSEFVVRLPTTSVVSTPSHPTETALQTGECRRVLVVDDNVDSAESLAMLLRASRHDVRTAHDGPTALEAALDHRPDVVLLDIGLPGLNGYEVAKRMRQQPSLRNIVLVAVSGYGQESDRQHSQEVGFDQHMVKPVDWNALMKLLAEQPAAPRK